MATGEQPREQPPATGSENALHVLARGPWEIERISASWLESSFEPTEAQSEAADEAIRGLRERGSPSHDGVAARLVDYRADDHGIEMELQPQRWALRLVEGDASLSVAALCVTRSADGRWLAGRRASWVASWAGRWALGAGGAVDLNENPAHTLVRELHEEWAVEPERVRGEALIKLPHGLVMFVGQAWLAEGVDRGSATRRRARRVPVVARRYRGLARRGRRGTPTDGELAVSVTTGLRAGVGPLTFTRLKWTSFVHSCVYTALLICAFAVGKPEPLTLVLGWTHGAAVDRDVAAVHHRRPPACGVDAPGGRGRRARRDRALLRQHPVRPRAARKGRRATASRVTPLQMRTSSRSPLFARARVQPQIWPLAQRECEP